MENIDIQKNELPQDVSKLTYSETESMMSKMQADGTAFNEDKIDHTQTYKALITHRANLENDMMNFGLKN